MTASTETTLKIDLSHAVLIGNSIPAHDETFDFAEEIATRLAAFHSYVARVRNAAQADAALRELAQAIHEAAEAVTA